MIHHLAVQYKSNRETNKNETKKIHKMQEKRDDWVREKRATK